MANSTKVPGAAKAYPPGVKFILSLSNSEIKEWLVAEIQGSHILSEERDLPVFDDGPTEAIFENYYQCPKRIQRSIRRSVLSILKEWMEGSLELSGGPGLRHLFNLVRELRLMEAKPFLQQVILQTELPAWSPDTVWLHLFQAAAVLTTPEDAQYWRLIAEQSPHYRVFIFVILLDISYEDALEVAQTIDYESIFNIEYLERMAPNFRDLIIDPSRRPPDLVSM